MLRALLVLPFLSSAVIHAAEPLYFEPNRGQTAAHVRYLARARHPAAAFVTDEGITLAPPAFAISAAPELKLIGAQPSSWFATGIQPGTTSYEVGPKNKWVADVPHYERLVKEAIYPGIDWILYGSQGRLEYDFAVAPGADPRAIELEFDRVDRIQIASNGDLLLHVGPSALTHKAPVAYQDGPGGRTSVRARYRLAGQRRVRFDIGEYDRARSLVIDPVIESATWLGGREDDSIAAIWGPGPFIAGSTASADFPVPATGKRRGIDGYVSSANFLRIFGGSGDDIVTSAPSLYLQGGFTNSRDLPLFEQDSPEFQPSYGGGPWDGFIRSQDKMNYLGGSGDDRILAVSQGSYGMAAAGSTDSPDFPVRAARQHKLAGGVDGFITYFHFDGAFSTYLGGPGNDRISAITFIPATVGPAETRDFQLVVAGETDSFEWLGSGAAAEGIDGFVATLTRSQPEGPILTGALRLGGSGTDRVTAMCATPDLRVVVGGVNASPDFVAGERSAPRPAQGDDYFAATISPGSSDVLWIDSGGGSGDDRLLALACAGNTGILAGGVTTSNDLDVTDPLPGGAPGGPSDGFITHWDSSGKRVYSTYYGGSGEDRVTAVYLDSAGYAAAAGVSSSASIPLVKPQQDRNLGGTDTFWLNLSTPGIAAPAVLAVGRGLLAPLSLRLTGSESPVGVPVTIESSDPQRVQLSPALTDPFFSRLVTAVSPLDAYGVREPYVSCNESSGGADLTVTAPGYPIRRVRVLCVPVAIVVGSVSGGRIPVRTGAVNPENGIGSPQAMRIDAPPISVRGAPEDAAQLEMAVPQVRLTPQSPLGQELSFRTRTQATGTALLLDSPDGVQFWPSSRIPVQVALPVNRAPITLSALAPGLATEVFLSGTPSGTYTFRSSHPGVVRLTTDRTRPGAPEVTVAYDAAQGRLTPQVFAEALDLSAGVRITAESGGLVLQSPPVVLAPLAAGFEWRSSLVRRVRLFAPETIRLTFRVYPIAQAAIGSLTVRAGARLRFRVSSSQPEAGSLDTTFTLEGGGSPPVFTFAVDKPGKTVIGVEPLEGTIARTMSLEVELPGEELPDDWIAGNNLVTSVMTARAAGTVTSSDPTRLLLGTSADGTGMESVRVNPGDTVHLIGLAASGTVDVTIEAGGEPARTRTVTLCPSGFAWSRSTYDFEGLPLVVFASALDPVTLVPLLQGQAVRRGLPGSIRLASSDPARARPARAEIPFPGFSGEMVTLEGDGPAEITIEQPPGFVEPAGHTTRLRVVERRQSPLHPALTGVNLQTTLDAVPGNEPLTFTSTDPSRLLLSTNPLAAGLPSVTVRGGPVHAYGIAEGDVRVVASRNGQEVTSAIVKVMPSTLLLFPAFDANFLGNPREIVQAAGSRLDLHVQTAAKYSRGVPFVEFSIPLPLRGGIASIPVEIVSSNPAAVAVSLQPVLNSSLVSSPASVSLRSAGTTSLSLVLPPGFSAPPAGYPRSIAVRSRQASIVNRDATIPQHFRTQLTANIEDGDPAVLLPRVPVTLKSSDPSKLLLSETATGAARPEITVQFGISGGLFYADALAGQGEVPIEMSSPGFASGTLTARLVPATIETLGGQAFSRQPETGQSLPIWIGTRGGGGTLHPTAPGITVRFSSSNPAVFVPAIPSIRISAGQSTDQRIPLRITGAGKSLLRAEADNGVASGEFEIDVRAADIQLSTSRLTIGKDLVEPVRIFGASTTTFTATTVNPDLVLVSDGPASTGRASAAIAGSALFYVHALANRGAAEIRVTAPGSNPATLTVDLASPSLILRGGQSLDLVSPLSAPIPFAAVLVSDPNGQQPVPLRQGAPPLTVTVESTNPAAGIATPASVTIQPGSAEVAFQFRALAEGATLLRLPVPPGFSDPGQARQRLITVAAPRLSPASPLRAPNQLVRQVQLSLNTAVPAPLTLTVTSADPARLLLLSSNGTANTSVTVTIPAGRSFVPIAIAGLAPSGTVALRVTAPGFPDTSFDVTLQPSALVFATGSQALRPGVAASLPIALTALDPVSLTPESGGAEGVSIPPGRRFTVRTESSDNSIAEPGPAVIIDSVTARPTISVSGRSTGLATLTLLQPEGMTEPAPRSRILISVQ